MSPNSNSRTFADFSFLPGNRKQSQAIILLPTLPAPAASQTTTAAQYDLAALLASHKREDNPPPCVCARK